MLTDKQGADLLAERNPDKRAAVVAALTEYEAKDYILRLLRILHREDRVEL